MSANDKLYNRIKASIIKYECYNNPKKLNEDVFQDTLYKCYKLINEKYNEMSDEDKIKYICKSYRNNLLRDKLYFRNKYEKCYEMIYDQPSYTRCDIDVSIINDFLYKNFSTEIVDLFNKHIYEGYSISELEKENKMKGLKYQFHKIKVFIKEFVLDK